jgi:hypothetical protein
VKISQKQVRLLHRWIGAIGSLALIFLASTGFLLHHESWMNSEGVDSLGDTPTLYRLVPGHPSEVYMLTKETLFFSSNSGAVYTPVRLKFPAEHIKNIVFDHQNGSSEKRIVVFEDGKLLRANDSRHIWESVPVPPGLELLVDFQVSETGTYHLVSNSGLWESRSLGKKWTQKKTFSGSHGLAYLIYRLHTGYIFQPVLVFVFDIAAILFLILGFSGLYLFFKSFQSKK